ncbi:hypothetical protein ABES80_18770, partial [Bacillus gobiensis]|uniref:hypothetical protein n=1 Tax=Bacillus gobiensis TaxID=1441095 RepID=UPI003D1CF2A6
LSRQAEADCNNQLLFFLEKARKNGIADPASIVANKNKPLIKRSNEFRTINAAINKSTASPIIV